MNLTSQPHIKPVCLPQEAGAQYGGQPAVVSGWGTVGSGASLNSALHQVTVTVFNDSGKGRFSHFGPPPPKVQGPKQTLKKRTVQTLK